MKSAPDFYRTHGLKIEMMELEIDSVRSIVIVGLCGGWLVANLELFCKQGPAAEVQNFFVRPEFRKLGIGRKMIEFAAERARASGNDSLALAVSKSNESAVEFYRRLGYHALAKPVT